MGKIHIGPRNPLKEMTSASVPIITPATIERIVYVDKPVYIDRHVDKIVEKPIYVDVIKEKQIEKIVEKKIYLDRFVEVPVEKLVEKVIYRDSPVETIYINKSFIPFYIKGIMALETLLIALLLLK